MTITNAMQTSMTCEVSILPMFFNYQSKHNLLDAQIFLFFLVVFSTSY